MLPKLGHWHCSVYHKIVVYEYICSCVLYEAFQRLFIGNEAIFGLSMVWGNLASELFLFFILGVIQFVQIGPTVAVCKAIKTLYCYIAQQSRRKTSNSIPGQCCSLFPIYLSFAFESKRPLYTELLWSRLVYCAIYVFYQVCFVLPSFLQKCNQRW